MASSFIERSRYYLADEYPAKLRLVLREIPASAIWHRPNEASNSIGNLVLHLAGNVREWIVSGIGGAPVTRDRASEFARRDGPGVEDLVLELESAVREADAVLAMLGEADLGRACTIQGRETTVLAAVYHVVEHFAMHTGQIILLAKVHVPGRIHFYDDAGGRAIPLWGGTEGMRQPGNG